MSIKITVGLLLVTGLLSAGCFFSGAKVDPYRSPDGRGYKAAHFGVRCLYCRRIIPVSQYTLDKENEVRCPHCSRMNPVSLLRKTPIYER